MGCLFCSFFARPLAPGARPGVLLPLLVNGVRKILTWVTVEPGQAATCSTCLPARKPTVHARQDEERGEKREMRSHLLPGVFTHSEPSDKTSWQLFETLSLGFVI